MLVLQQTQVAIAFDCGVFDPVIETILCDFDISI